jgi:putative PEP-CTERM system TPR-repeat lipoprotein
VEVKKNMISRIASWRTLAAVATCAALLACKERSAGDSIASAEANIAKRDYSSAIVELKYELSKDPARGIARYLLGVAFLGQGQFAQALTELNRAIEFGFDEDRVRGKHAVALIGSGRTEEVLREYKDLNLRDPGAIAEVKTAVAIAHLSAKRIAEAERALDEALEANPNSAWTLINKARIELHRGKSEEALRLVEAAIDRNALSGEAWHFKGAMLQVVRNDLSGAERAFKEAAKDVRFAAAATGSLASLYVANGRVAELREMHKTLLKSNPKSPGNTLIEAQIAYMERRFDVAREALDKLLRDRPNDPRLLLFSGSVDFELGALRRAEAQLVKAVRYPDGSQTARRLLARTYLRMGQPERAYNTIVPLVETGQSDSNAYVLAGEASLQLGMLQRAESLYAAAAKLRPNDVQLKTVMAMINLGKGQITDAFDSLHRIASTDPGDAADKALISAYLRRAEFDAALGAVERLAQKKSNPIDVALYRGLILRAKGEFPAARSAFETVLKLQANHFLGSAQLAELELKDGQVDAARKRLLAALAANPQDATARMSYSSFLLSIGAKPEEVRAFLEESVNAIPDEPRLRAALVTQNLRLGDAKSGLTVAQQAIAVFPENIEVLDALGRAQADSGNDEQAISIFTKISTLTARNALPYVRLADIYGKRRDTVSAARSLRKAFELAPEQREVHIRMLALAKRTGDAALALGAAKELQRSRPDSLSGYFLEGDVHAGKGNWPAAIGAFKAALGKPDAVSAAPIRVYDASLAAGQLVAAERFATDWVKAHPKDGPFLEHVGLRALNGKKYAEAERLLEQAIAVNPRSVAALNNLAWVRAAMGSKSAVATAERALALAPRSPALLDTLAAALASEKNLAKAIQVQSQAVAVSGGQPQYRVNLARLLLQFGDKAKARGEVEAIIAADARLGQNKAVVELRTMLDAR